MKNIENLTKIEKIKEMFNNEIADDNEFNNVIWINYIEDREIREKVALNQFIKLYLGEKKDFIEVDSILNRGIIILDKFFDYTKNNLEFTKKLIKDFFFKIKEDIIKNNINFNIEEFINKIDKTRYNYKKKQFDKMKNLYLNNELTIEEIEKYKLQALKDIKNIKDSSKIKNLYEKIKDSKNKWSEILKKYEEFYEDYYKKIEKLKEVWGNNSITASLGWDLSNSDFSMENINNLIKIEKFIRIEDNKEINKLLKKLGKSKVDTNKIKSNRIRKRINFRSNNEILGITRSSDITRVLSSEYTLLNNKLLKYYFYQKYIESELLSYRLADNKNEDNKNNKRNEGPFIICLDTSSSMEGLPEILSKSITIDIIKQAKKQKRDIYLIMFGSIDEVIELKIDYTKENSIRLLKFLQKKYYGGTDFVTPIKKSFELIDNKKIENADILMISDGLVKIPNDFIKKINETKQKRDIKIYSLIINTEKIKDKFSDEVYYYKYKNSEKKVDRKVTRREISFYADDLSLFID
ncbi:von Willebrand factor type A domain-containing protein [Hypnocyclicus thermotrophus]|uniref:von Willebrand factor type A domain-containing protein n=1 Tax=Hypnocyclicus thermotrophus TaxID=1627895 RepID=A0AA46I6M8_9FUSO|nr:VWA domain-containing protein [Hypnocyclicus thermotrophus]TDT71936.1 von Willebrand factor type A domain-containing protein [Hypnocyclicus thermotrophus]